MTTSHGNQQALDELAAYCNHGHAHHSGDRFGRMFPDLAPLYTDPRVLNALGEPGGPMDAGTSPPKSKTVPVGQVFFGQFIDHDITLDVESSLDAVNRPSDIANARTPTLDLDCVYGAGPEASPFMYQASGPFKGIKLVTARDLRSRRDPVKDHDLARNGQDVALIGDFRNDENRVISQLQLGMIKVHNAFVDEIHTNDGLEGHELFEEAQRATRWHYQWAVLHDFLVAICGKDTVHRILSEGRRFYTPKIPFIPVEFSVAAYRFGHSMVPLNVAVRRGGTAEPLFRGALGNGFDAVPGPEAIVEWEKVFFVNNKKSGVQRAERLDPGLAPELLDLRVLDSETAPENRSLAARNLRRGQSFLLPSGEEVASAVGRPDAEISVISRAAHKASKNTLHGATPLWFYLLTEASVVGRDGADKGEGLGPAGATIVAEVIIGLLEGDSRSWLGTNRDWVPIAGRETIGDLLQWACEDAIIDLREAVEAGKC